MDVGLVQAIRFLPSRPEPLTPFHHPLRVAEDVAGLDPGERWGRLFESLHIIRRCYSEDVFDPRLLHRAGREGYHLQGGRHGIDTYLQGLEQSGYDEHDFNYQVFHPGHVAATRARAWDEAQEGVYHYRDFYTYGRSISGTRRFVPPSPSDLRHDPNPPELVGTPDEILRRLEPQLKDSRVTHFGLLHRMAGMSTEVSRSSLDLYAKEIMPILRTWGRAPRRCSPSSADALRQP